MAEDDIPFDRSLQGASHGGSQEAERLSPLVSRLICPNAGPFTFTGTCSYLIGDRDAVVIDPGPVNSQHRDRLLRALAGRTTRAILVTHTHRDHSLGALALKAATGAPIYGPPPLRAGAAGAGMEASALDAAHDPAYAPDVVLADGDTIGYSGFELSVLATPGHTSNHLAYALAPDGALFSGDHVMAWSTTVIAPPDGSMRDYMASLQTLIGRTDTVYWPGHGGPVRDPQRFVRALIHHRRQREHAILAQLRDGDRSVADIVCVLYKGLAPALRGAAGLSVLAHLQDLRDRGLALADGDGAGTTWHAADQFSVS